MELNKKNRRRKKKGADCNATVPRLGDANHLVHYTDQMQQPRCRTQHLLPLRTAELSAHTHAAHLHKNRWMRSPKRTQIHSLTNAYYRKL